MTDLSIFVSYAHSDNSATHGRVHGIARDIGHSYAALTGQPAKVFLDTESIALGENWRDRIRSGLSNATIFLAFVSPSYLNSGPCRSELREFLSFLGQDGSSRLIIPLLLTESGRMDEMPAGDDLWTQVTCLQYLPIEKMKFEDQGSGAWMTTIAKVVDRVAQVLSEQADQDRAISTQLTEPASSSSDQIEDPRGVLDEIADVEESLPELGRVATDFASIIGEFNVEITSATPRIQHASSFSQRLAISRELATNLTPIVDRALTSAQEMASVVRRLDPGIISLIRFAQNAPDRESAEAQVFFGQLREMASIGVTSISSVEVLEASIKQSKGNSADLDRPLDKMQRALILVVETQAIYKGWLDELGAIG